MTKLFVTRATTESPLSILTMAIHWLRKAYRLLYKEPQAYKALIHGKLTIIEQDDNGSVVIEYD